MPASIMGHPYAQGRGKGKSSVRCGQHSIFSFSLVSKAMAHFRGYFNLEEKDAKMASFCYYTSFVRRKEICDVKPKLAFSALLPTVTSSENAGEGAHSGKKFMTNLLVSSLMEESELKSALLTAIKVEVSKNTVF